MLSIYITLLSSNITFILTAKRRWSLSMAFLFFHDERERSGPLGKKKIAPQSLHGDNQIIPRQKKKTLPRWHSEFSRHLESR